MLDYDQLAAEYARHRRVHPGVLRDLVAAVHGDARVLEVGCGTGNYVRTLSSRIGCPCWGVDPSAEMLSQARARAPDVRFQVGRAERLDYVPGSFDLVFSVDVIHHVGDRPRYIDEAYRVLAPGGQLCTVTDSEWIIRHRQPLATHFPETVEAELRRYPRIADLRATMARAGFDDITEDTVAFSYPLTDIQIYRDKAYSALHVIPEAAFQRGIARLERDLRAGPIPAVSRYTLLWGRKQQSAISLQPSGRG
jgi:ubiquinone/menaquinone biosynthesis C-methylase UbiE